jgi:hypothetical protein
VVRAIERALRPQLGVGVKARCAAILGVPSSCVAILADGTELPVRVAFIAGQWDIAVQPTIITTAPIVAYVEAELADLGIRDLAVHCGPPIRVAPPATTPLACTLGDGGARALVTIDPSGDIENVELALDRAAADARTTPRSDAELDQLSRALAHLADDEADDAAAETDGDTDGGGSGSGSTKHRR